MSLGVGGPLIAAIRSSLRARPAKERISNDAGTVKQKYRSTDDDDDDDFDTGAYRENTEEEYHI